MRPEKFVAYELGGESLRDAQALHITQSLNADEIGLYYGGDFEAHQADILSLKMRLGQHNPATRITLVDGCAPRAYKHYPALYFHPADKTRVYMVAPIDFKARHFMPEDANMLRGEELENFTAALHAGAGQELAPLTAVIPPHGTRMPMDFDPRSPLQNFNRYAPPFAQDKVATLLRVMDSVRTYLVENKAVGGVTEGSAFTFKAYLTYERDGRPGIMACAERLKDQARLSMTANAYFTPERPLNGPLGYYKILPNPKFAGGLALQSFFDMIPSLTPDEIWALRDAQDLAHGIKPPQTPAQYLSDARESWPFPRNAPLPRAA